MDKNVYDAYVAILRKELTLATGCTEPIAIAYAGAKIREVMGVIPEYAKVYCSGNIVKNVMAVTVPNSGGERGIPAAALLGMIGGNPDRVLDVLSSINPDHIKLMKKMEKEGCCETELVEGVANLYIRIEAKNKQETALVEISEYHDNIIRIEKNGNVLLDKRASESDANDLKADKSLLNVRGIYDFATEVDIEDVREVLERQVDVNYKIAIEGLTNPWGAEVGRTIYDSKGGDSLVNRARAYAAAGSDARMNGCAMPVVINSGSGNQGITVSMPLYVYAQEYRVEHEKMLRGLALANLISIHAKRFIGSLSAFCGAVSAATGSACGIAFMLGADYDTVCGVITNSVNTDGGMICDGAKSSCAAKIATAVDMALLAMEMSRKGHVFKPGEGLVEANIEETIASVGRMGRVGMKSTDVEILNIMLGK